MYLKTIKIQYANICIYTGNIDSCSLYNNLYFLGNVIEFPRKTNDESRYRQVLLVSLKNEKKKTQPEPFIFKNSLFWCRKGRIVNV